MQPKAMTDQELVKICLTAIAQRSGYDASQRLTQRDLEFLCDNIEEKTNILISVSTMKRLLNGQFSRLPQVATLNAISQYLGYENWQHFKQQKQQQVKEAGVPTQMQEADPPLQPQKRRYVSRYKVMGIGFVMLLTIAILAYKTLSTYPAGNYKNVSFSFRKTTSNDLPNTVVFHYNIDQVNGDSFFIQQSWDRNRRIRIHKNNYTLTDIYYEPGYHKAKLIVNDQVVKTIDVSIPTNGWFLYVKKQVPGSIPVYIRKERLAANGVLGLNKEDLDRHRINTADAHVYCYTFFPGVQPVSSDNFILRARIRVTNPGNAACPMIMNEVFTQKSFIFFRAAPAGCTGEIDALFGEDYLSGKTNDLSGFGCDITQWQDYEMEVRNKQATVRINGKQVFRKQYKESSGMITGLGFNANGPMEIDRAELKGLDSTVVFAGNFDQ